MVYSMVWGMLKERVYCTPVLLANLRDNHNADFTIDPLEIENRLALINLYKAPGPTQLVPAGLRAISVSAIRGSFLLIIKSLQNA